VSASISSMLIPVGRSRLACIASSTSAGVGSSMSLPCDASARTYRAGLRGYRGGCWDPTWPTSGHSTGPAGLQRSLLTASRPRDDRCQITSMQHPNLLQYGSTRRKDLLARQARNSWAPAPTAPTGWLLLLATCILQYNTAPTA
jgi:hypothetical protein